MLRSASRWATITSLALASTFATSAALADDPPAPPTDPSWTSDELPSLPPSQVPPNVKVQPNGGVVVTQTPDQKVDVHARTPSGTIHAYGCDRVVFDPNDKSGPLPPGVAAPPCAAPPPPPPPPPAYGYQPRYYPAYTPVVGRREKPRYAPDPGRKAALIASSLVFGLGTVASGTTYIVNIADRGVGDCSLIESCGNRDARTSLLAMGAIMTFTPSIPRFVVGDWKLGLLWTGLRGGSFALGSAINWGADGAIMPVTFSFLAPLTLGIIDLATTPHRENLEPKVKVETASLKLDGFGPTAMVDQRGNTVPALGAMGRW
ncbi:MAG: hypothetical protein IPK82_12125 [Polyangiaceae bacterium]|nr:hypothetical protein [Polyangiaceae bacterium]